MTVTPRRLQLLVEEVQRANSVLAARPSHSKRQRWHRFGPHAPIPVPAFVVSWVQAVADVRTDGLPSGR
jgi:hypothetical protein